MNKKKIGLYVGILFMCCSAFCSSTGQLMWKLALINQPALVLYGVGFMLYGIGAVSMIIALRFGELSNLHPILSLGFVLSVVWGGTILREKIGVIKLLGIGFIITGVILLSHRKGKRS